MAIASIKSTRNGVPATAQTGNSREDISLNDVLTLESVGAGAVTHSWSILFLPDGSVATLSSTNTAVTQFTADKEGAYLIRLVVDAGLETEQSQHLRFRVLTEFGGLQLIAAGERRDQEAVIPKDVGVYGWAYEQNNNIRKLLDFLKPIVSSSRAVYVDANNGTQNYADFSTIQAAINYCENQGASASDPYVVIVRAGLYEENLTLKPNIHLISTQPEATPEIPDFVNTPINPHISTVKFMTGHTVLTPNPEDLCMVVGFRFLCETVSATPMILKTGDGVFHMAACHLESTPIAAGQGALVELSDGRFVSLDCKFEVTDNGDVANFAFKQTGETTTSVFKSSTFLAPSGLAINPTPHNCDSMILHMRDCVVQNGGGISLADNGRSYLVNSVFKGSGQSVHINWLGTTYGIANSGDSVHTFLWCEIEGDIYWNKDNTINTSKLRLGSVSYNAITESGAGSAVVIEALTQSKTSYFDNTNSSLVSQNVQDAIEELEGLLNNLANTAVLSASNVGGGEGVFKQKNVQDLEFKTLVGDANISVNQSGADELQIAFTGTLASNQIAEGDSSVTVTDAGTGDVTIAIDGSPYWIFRMNPTSNNQEFSPVGANQHIGFSNAKVQVIYAQNLEASSLKAETGVSLSLGADNQNFWTIDNPDGHFVPVGTGVQDVGSMANRVRSIYVDAVTSVHFVHNDGVTDHDFTLNVQSPVDTANPVLLWNGSPLQTTSFSGYPNWDEDGSGNWIPQSNQRSVGTTSNPIKDLALYQNILSIDQPSSSLNQSLTLQSTPPASGVAHQTINTVHPANNTPAAGDGLSYRTHYSYEVGGVQKIAALSIDTLELVDVTAVDPNSPNYTTKRVMSVQAGAVSRPALILDGDAEKVALDFPLAVKQHTTAEITGLSSPIGGMLVYDTDTNEVKAYQDDNNGGLDWIALGSGGGGGVSLSDFSVNVLAASGGGSLVYNNATGVFNFTPADLGAGPITGGGASARIAIWGGANNVTSNEQLTFDGAAHTIFLNNTGSASQGAYIHFANQTDGDYNWIVGRGADGELFFRTQTNYSADGVGSFTEGDYDVGWSLDTSGNFIPTGTNAFGELDIGSSTSRVADIYANQIVFRDGLNTADLELTASSGQGGLNGRLTFNGNNVLAYTSEIFDGDYGSLTNVPSGIVFSDNTIDAQPVRQYYANQAALPNATDWHGAIAHSHADGAMYFAHGAAWNKLANYSEVPQALTDLSIADGNAGEILTTDGLGNFSFTGAGQSDRIYEHNTRVVVEDNGGGSGNGLFPNGTGYIQFIIDNTEVWRITDNGHIIPQSTEDYDIGSADNKVRHLFLSDNSIKFSDTANNINYSLGFDLANGERLTFAKDSGFDETLAYQSEVFSGAYADLTTKPTYLNLMSAVAVNTTYSMSEANTVVVCTTAGNADYTVTLPAVSAGSPTPTAANDLSNTVIVMMSGANEVNEVTIDVHGGQAETINYVSLPIKLRREGSSVTLVFDGAANQWLVTNLVREIPANEYNIPIQGSDFHWTIPDVSATEILAMNSQQDRLPVMPSLWKGYSSPPAGGKRMGWDIELLKIGNSSGTVLECSHYLENPTPHKWHIKTVSVIIGFASHERDGDPALFDNLNFIKLNLGSNAATKQEWTAGGPTGGLTPNAIFGHGVEKTFVYDVAANQGGSSYELVGGGGVLITVEAQTNNTGSSANVPICVLGAKITYI